MENKPGPTTADPTGEFRPKEDDMPRREDPSQRHGPRRPLLATTLLGIGLSAVLVTGACGAETTAAKDKSSVTSGTAMNSTTSTGAVAKGEPRTIPQPPIPGDIPVAPESKRVDLSMPTFSDPTNVTNPLFPVSKQDSVLMVGHVDGKPFRTEVTLLPETRIIEWQGQRIETLVSQYTAYLDGRIQEVAYDLYAQADDGSVWYFGEDVADLKDGAIVTKEGTWIAGKNRPPAMIMPSDPKVGDAYRTENAPGIAFEEVTVKRVGKTLRGPLGPIEGGLLGEELHMDGKTEGKIFAPGYGEFYTSDGGDVEALAEAVPTDAASGPLPPEAKTLSEGALRVLDEAGSKDWNAASATVEKMNAAWRSYPGGEVPRRIRPRMTDALAALTEAIDSRDGARAGQAAIDTAQWGLDLRLRYRPQTEIDLARFDLWAAQLTLDAAAGDTAAVNGDVFTLYYIRDRILPALDNKDVTRIDTALGKLQTAQATMSDKDLAAAADDAGRLRAIVRPPRQ
jgi:hypothetical protein